MTAPVRQDDAGTQWAIKGLRHFASMTCGDGGGGGRSAGFVADLPMTILDECSGFRVYSRPEDGGGSPANPRTISAHRFGERLALTPARRFGWSDGHPAASPASAVELAERSPPASSRLFAVNSRRAYEVGERPGCSHARRLSGGASTPRASGGLVPRLCRDPRSARRVAIWRASIPQRAPTAIDSRRRANLAADQRQRPCRTVPVELSDHSRLRDVVRGVFLLEELPPWHSNRLSCLIKTPKVHLGDTGLARALLGLDAAALMRDRVTLGQLLRIRVLGVTPAGQLAGGGDPVPLPRQRGAEVGIVMERHRGCGSGVKAGATVTAGDFRGLRLSDAAERFTSGWCYTMEKSSRNSGRGFTSN